MESVTGPVRVACTPLTATAGAVVTSTTALAEVAGHPPGGQDWPPLPDPHALKVSKDKTSAVTNTVRMRRYFGTVGAAAGAGRAAFPNC